MFCLVKYHIYPENLRYHDATTLIVKIIDLPIDMANIILWKASGMGVVGARSYFHLISPNQQSL